ncbi:MULTISPECIES: hypothetical protein [Actinomadura]|uniref:Uncharacterized protein n=1 Tax=Actinomadura miaoliensis TaxID=430685 RepID=A0ABP7X5P0_9ACTN
MLAIVAAVLFGLALLFDLADVATGSIGSAELTTLGLLLLALHLAGYGTTWHRRWSRRR